MRNRKLTHHGLICCLLPADKPLDPAAGGGGDRGRGGMVVVGGVRRARNVRARMVAVQRARAQAAIPEEEEEEGGSNLVPRLDGLE